ncbi:glycoside hydrolase domain-containing protein [Streptomyces sp. NRRL S-340]|uniref:glycoside hydrolase domain-containing protein n=1 Tax=Streptomyces sp. NRRL S-340 TaxID=1463901 RepID=UPI00099CB84D|nr:glycoside hydrolase domain-containing protein [Streptomyces sp. NRRL S-340]
MPAPYRIRPARRVARTHHTRFPPGTGGGRTAGVRTRPTEEHTISAPRPPRALVLLTALTACAALAAGATCLPAAARPASGGAPGPASGATRNVAYRGHTFTVPADWQVVDLTADPTACVRFDRHAVYLGDPAGNQDCPARVTGRTEALWVRPATTTKAAVTENRTAHLFHATAAAEGIAVTAPYRDDRATVERVLDSAGLPVATARTETADPVTDPAQSVPALPADATAHRGKGFDTCAAPGQSAMDAWKAGSPYGAVGIYIGGVNRGCAQANLTADWVRTQYTKGWRVLPLYVGPQPSAGAGSCADDCAAITDPAAQGRAAAEDAAAQAGALGLGKGAVLYNDLEQYTPGAAVTARVLGYLEAWTGRLHELGYRSGAYGSVSSLVADLVGNATGTTLPDVIHFAHWNDEAVTTDAALPAALWADGQRVHQYAGDRTETYGGAKINIDRDQLDVGTGA